MSPGTLTVAAIIVIVAFVGLPVRAGALRADMAEAVRAAFGLIAMLSSGGDAIEAPLSFRDGEAYLGPVPLGPAPRL